MQESKFKFRINQETQKDPAGEKARALQWLEDELKKMDKPDEWIQDRKYMLHEMLNPPVPGGLSGDQDPMDIAREYFENLNERR